MLLLDGHVHLHDCFDPARFLASAQSNFRSAAAGLGLKSGFTPILMLTESLGQDKFGWLERLARGVGSGAEAGVPGWSFHPTGEEVSLKARSGTGPDLILVAGRQVAATEGLEVLALGTREVYQDGGLFTETVEEVLRSGALAVIPWGFGKWLGRRGSLVGLVLEEARSRPGLFLGDNGGRALIRPQPGYLKKALEMGLKVISGTDPLPFASQSDRAGAFGNRIRARISTDRPAGELKTLLLDPATGVQPYGRLTGPLRFVFLQVAMQVVKRRAPARREG